MALFQKKRGRKKKVSIFKRIFHWGIAIFLLFIVLPLVIITTIFSDFLFLLPYKNTLMGDNAKATYLVTLHNEGELRPELGFLTSFVFVEIENGKVAFEFHDSYDVQPAPQKITAPEPIESRFQHAKKYAGWTFRDSNFSLEHPQNAAKFIEFLQYDPRYASKQFDGVISLDLYSIGKIIDSIGGIELEGTTLTSENIFSVLESNAKDFDHHSEEEWMERKNSLSPLASQLMKKIIFSPFHWKRFSHELTTLLTQKHILLFFTDQKIQQAIQEKKWTGELQIPQKSLIIGNNIANIGGRKGDRYIRKQFFSTFSVSPRGKITETFRVNLQHDGTRSLYSDRYFAEIQILRKQGTKLKNTDIKGVTKQNISNLDIFSFPVILDPNESKSFSFTFSVPQKIRPESKPLNIFSLHQAGSLDDEVFITFQGAGDTSFTIDGCEKIKNTENISQCSFIDMQDTQISITQNPDTKAPLLERSEWIDDGKKVEIVFSENIESLNPAQVFLREKQSGKAVNLQNIQVENTKVILTLLSPIDITTKTFYSLQIENLSDLSGNTIEVYRTTLVSKK